MIMVTDAWLAQMEESTDYIETVIITLADNTQIALGRDDLRFGDSITSGSESNSVPIGEAVCKTCTIHIDNSDGTYDNTNFLGASIVVKASMYLTEMEWTEEIILGTFYVAEPQETGTVIEVTGVDAMHKADKPFAVPQTLPVTAATLYQNACTQAGLQYNTLTFYNYDFVINAVPTGLTCRQVIGYIAMIACGNAVINTDNRVDIITYYFPDPADYPDDWVYPVFKNWVQPPNLYANDITITGVKTVVTSPTGEETTYTQGTDDYVVVISNPLITGREQDVVDDIWSTIAGISFFPFSGSHTGYPMAEFMDSCVVIDVKGGVHYSFVTQFEFTFLSTTQISNTLPPPIIQNSSIPSESSQVERKTHEAIKTEVTRIDTAIADINTRISGMTGMYITEVTQPGGGVVIYQHDKPTLAESQKIWMETADTRAVSMDGGQTWVAGVTADGQAIVRHLAAEGVSASWIDAGTLQISNGSSILFLASIDTGTVNIAGWTIDGTRIYKDVPAAQSADGKHFYIGLRSYPYTASQSNPYNLVFWVQYDDIFRFYVRSNGFLYASDAEISGKITATSGVIGGWTIDGSRIYKDVPAASSGDGKHYYIGMRSNPYDATQTNPYNLAFFVQYDDLFRFYVRSNGYLFASDADIKGKITATSGEIAGWSITQYSLKATSNGLTTGMQIPSHGVYAIAVGSSNETSWSSAPFRVTHAGAMYATNAEINGSIRTVDDGRYTEIKGGYFRCGKVDTNGDIQTGTLRPIAWGDDYSNYEGVLLGATGNAKYLVLGYYSSGWVGAIIINNGLNPHGYTQKIIMDATSAFRNDATFYSHASFESNVNLNINNETHARIASASLSDGTTSRTCRSLYVNGYGFALGRYTAHDWTSGEVGYVFNNGCNHAGHTEEHLIYGSVYFNSNITFKNVTIAQNTYSYESGNIQAVKVNGNFIVGSNGNMAGYRMRIDAVGTDPGSIYCDGKVSCTSLTQRSDEKLKNITEYDDRYTEVLDELEPINFTWKDLKGDREHVGLGARQTKAILDAAGLTNSGLVQVEPDIDEYSINYSELTVMLLAKVQEQQKTIDALESRLKRLETLVEGLI